MKVGSGNGMFPGGVVLATAWKRKALLPGAAQEYRDHVVMLFTPHGRFGEAAILRKVLRLAQEWHITDRAPRTVKEYQETVEYIHWNPLRRGLVKRPEDWKWSSVHEYAFAALPEARHQPPLRIDGVRIPADERARI
jgi:hypothetical protein